MKDDDSKNTWDRMDGWGEVLVKVILIGYIILFAIRMIFSIDSINLGPLPYILYPALPVGIGAVIVCAIYLIKKARN